jgi:hypothetical protein
MIANTAIRCQHKGLVQANGSRSDQEGQAKLASMQRDDLQKVVRMMQIAKMGGLERAGGISIKRNNVQSHG